MFRMGLRQAFEPLRIDSWVVGLIGTTLIRLSIASAVLAILLMLTGLSFVAAAAISVMAIAILAAALALRLVSREWPTPPGAED